MRFELSEGTNHKFWEITRTGKVLHISWGRIGTAGQSQNKSFGSPEAAEREYVKLVDSKRKKGYVDAGGGTPAAKAAKAARPTKAATPAKAVPSPSPLTSAALDKAKARAVAAGAPVTRPVRSVSLMELSGIGQMGPSLADSLKHDRARFVQYGRADKKLTKLKRLRKLELRGEMPAWIGELEHLRTLVCWAPTKLPASLLTLPHLRFLHIDNSPKLESLGGIEKLRALHTVTCGNTPLAEEEGALDALAKRLGAKTDPFIPGIERKPAVPRPPKDRKAIVKAINDDTLPDCSPLRGVDLSGSTFRDAYISHDLRGAKLANTVWIGCDFEWAYLTGADLTGALFYDCYFDSSSVEGTLSKVKARGAVWIGCGGDLGLGGADLREAAMIDMNPDYGLEIEKAHGQGMYLQGAFCSEREHRWAAKGADLRGATIQLDITSGRRAELQKKKTARLAWKTDHLKGAKIDKTTRLDYAPLDPVPTAPTTRAAESTVDPKGKAAPILGRIYAANAGLWLVVADADVAQGWRGAVDEDDPQDDFQRALRTKDGEIAIGRDNGVRVDIGHRSGWSYLFGATSDHPGLRLVDAALSGDDRAASDRGMALRMEQWPVTVRPKRVGTFACPSGVVALMLPYVSGAFPPKMRAQARPGKAVIEPNDHDRALVVMPSGPGLYEVARYPFRPEKGRGDYEDERGEYGEIVSITYHDRLPKK